MTDPFARVLAAFCGERFLLDEHGTRALRAAFASPAADLAITASAFRIRPARQHEQEHAPSAAPGVVSFLVERGGRIGRREVRSWIASTALPELPARHVLAEAWPSRVMIRIREHEAELDDELPTLSARKFARYPHACPHCGRVPERYRVVSERGLVCVACGAASAAPT